MVTNPALLRELVEVGGGDQDAPPLPLPAEAGIENAANHAAAFLAARGLESVWLHLDADCLDDALMPAVDWRIEGGLAPTEVIALARPLLQSGLIAGMDVTIYNPSLDSSDFAAGRVLLDVIEQILA